VSGSALITGGEYDGGLEQGGEWDVLHACHAPIAGTTRSQREVGTVHSLDGDAENGAGGGEADAGHRVGPSFSVPLPSFVWCSVAKNVDEFVGCAGVSD
jgi:hypothetical protein